MSKPTLGNKDIVTVPSGRRRFLRAIGAGSTALVGIVMTSSCSSSDNCDNDRTTDGDTGINADPANRKRDRCDSD
jgi:hypothetical protein